MLSHTFGLKVIILAGYHCLKDSISLNIFSVEKDLLTLSADVPFFKKILGPTFG
jgi:hypothetical protein